MTSITAGTANRFRALELTQFQVLGSSFRACETLSLRLSDYPPAHRDPGDPYVRFYILTFNMVRGGSIRAGGLDLGTVERWDAHRKSTLLDETLDPAIEFGETFVHFEVFGQQANLDVVARDFSFAIVDMIRIDFGDLTAPSPPSGRGA